MFSPKPSTPELWNIVDCSFNFCIPPDKIPLHNPIFHVIFSFSCPLGSHSSA